MADEQELKEQLQSMAGTDRAGIMMVCLHGQMENRVYGEIVNRFLKSPVPFFGLDQLLLSIDEICELVGTPMLTMAPRFLQEEVRSVYAGISRKKKLCGQKQAGWKQMEDALKKEAPLTREILEIQILFRGNATMQGRLRCPLSGKKYISFRSALELLRMLKEVETVFCKKNSSRAARFGFAALQDCRKNKGGEAI